MKKVKKPIKKTRSEISSWFNDLYDAMLRFNKGDFHLFKELKENHSKTYHSINDIEHAAIFQVFDNLEKYIKLKTNLAALLSDEQKQFCEEVCKTPIELYALEFLKLNIPKELGN
jgi:hypothetical protein